jgi:hypothetical protein
MLTISKHLLHAMSRQLHSRGETMRTECAHLHISGQKCHAPAVNGSSLCRHHRPRNCAEHHAPLSLPPISDRSSLLVAIFEVLQAISERRISRADAGTLLFGLQMASRVMSEIDNDIEQALASGEEDNAAEPGISDSTSNPACESGAEREALIQQAQALMAAIQNGSSASCLDCRRPNLAAALPKARIASQTSPARRPGNPPLTPLTPHPKSFATY